MDIISYNIRCANYEKKAKHIIKELSNSYNSVIILLQESNWADVEVEGFSVVDGRERNLSDCRTCVDSKYTRNIVYQHVGLGWSCTQLADVYVANVHLPHSGRPLAELEQSLQTLVEDIESRKIAGSSAANVLVVAGDLNVSLPVGVERGHWGQSSPEAGPVGMQKLGSHTDGGGCNATVGYSSLKHLRLQH